MGVNRYLGGVITANQNPPTVESASGTWTLEEAYQNIGNWPMALNTVYDSLKFNSADSAYLSRTPATASNRKTWTWSGWVKRSGLGSVQTLFMAGAAGTDYTSLFFNSTDTLCFHNVASSANAGRKFSSAVYRDVGAWYHIVAVFNTDSTTANDRMILYVNGTRLTAYSPDENPNSGQVGQVNNNAIHTVSRNSTSAVQYINGYLTEINFIDGLALDADYFGFFDANGIWQPRAYKGAYGTNGFYLPMRESATASGFSTVTYTGTATTNNVTGVGFAPDFVWIKDREYASGSDHFLFDSLRTTYSLSSNTTGAETQKNNDGFTSLDSDGFTLNGSGGGDNINRSGSEMVAWCWDAGSSTVTNNDGTITSTVRANQTYGFSVVTYTGNNTANQTVGHGIGVAPSMIIVKNRTTGATSWAVYHASVGTGKYLELNKTDTPTTNSAFFDQVTSTVFGFDAGGSFINANGDNYVAYCFSEISGYSKFGSYTGNGSASGPTVTLGFRPAFVMIKKTSDVDDWAMFDTTRQPTGALTKFLSANSSGAEQTGTSPYITVSDTGFQITATSNLVNTSSGTYIYMAFADTRAYSAFDDYSGNGNNWQPNNIGTDDVYVDVPTNWGTDTGVGGEVRGNYATLNPIAASSNLTFSNGNLQVVSASSSDLWCGQGTMTLGVPVYIEGTVIGSHSTGSGIGIYDITQSLGTYNGSGSNVIGVASTAYAMTFNNGSIKNSNSVSSYGSAFASGDIWMMAYDPNNGKIWWGKNGTWFNSGNPATGTNPAYSGITGTKIFGYSVYSTGVGFTANFGATPFSYTAPSGFKALCTQNLPEPTIADGEDYMDALLWTGNGSTQNITGLSFQPDLVWTKDRGAAYDHTWFDAVRGATKFLRSNATSAEETQSDSLTSFNSNGFSVGADAVRNNINKSGASYVSWNWKANGAGVLNEVGTIDSTVSANTTAGFSIAAYTSDGASTQTFGHGLGVTPAFVIIKARDRAGERWPVWHQSLSTNGFVALNETSAVSTASTVFQTASITNSVIAIGNNASVGNSGTSYICYAFAPVAGYSAFGSYTGNGSTDGPFVYTGFRPRYILTKSSSASATNWVIQDTERFTYNLVAGGLLANTSAAEYSSGYDVDILSNGFKLRRSGGDTNASGATYIYAAFAENPFKLSRAR